MGDYGHGKTQNAINGTTWATVQGKVKGTADNAPSTLDRAAGTVMQKGQRLLDTVFPPDKREAFFTNLKAFMLANPKLSAFLGMNLALTGIPLALFMLYSLSVLISSLIVGIVVGLLGAVSFTVLAVGAALLVVFPTVFFTTGAACFLFLLGLGGYYILRWASKDVQREPKKPSPVEAISDSSVTDERHRRGQHSLDAQ